MAVPVSSNVSLMSAPDSESALIKVVPRREMLVLVNREPRRGWYNVIDVPLGKEGWVNETDVSISLTKHPLRTATFQEEYAGMDGAPRINVLNKTGSNLSLKIGDTHYTINPRSELPVSVPAGIFKFYASEPGVIPVIGRQEFKRSYRYSWTFWVEKTIVPVP
ncbi:MAG TPA: hypothetical protein VMF56_12370 [Acidobacteriaceae bacterium]|nr:hypothetical protein [Acidobacteriaceae bacterium]